MQFQSTLLYFKQFCDYKYAKIVAIFKLLINLANYYTFASSKLYLSKNACVVNFGLFSEMEKYGVRIWRIYSIIMASLNVWPV